MSQFVVGLTGGIGSGKTTVSDMFADYGITIADADVVAREIVEPGQATYNNIVERYGDAILQDDRSLDRARLREIIFAKDEERLWLEAQSHRLIIKNLKIILDEADSEYAILVLSAGAGRSPLIDEMLVVDASESAQIERVMERDANSQEQVQAIMQKQPDRKERAAWADDIIHNDGSLLALQKQVSRLHDHYLAAAKIKQSDCHTNTRGGSQHG